MRFLVASSRESSEAIELAEELQRLGHHATLVTPHPETDRARGLPTLAEHEVGPGRSEAIVAHDAAAVLAVAQRDPRATRIMVAGPDEMPPQVPGAVQAVVVSDDRSRLRIAASAVPARVELVTANLAERVVALASELGATPELHGPLAELSRLMRLVDAAEERAARADSALREHLAQSENLAALHAAVRSARDGEAAAHRDAARHIAALREAVRLSDRNAAIAYARAERDRRRAEESEAQISLLDPDRRVMAAQRKPHPPTLRQLLGLAPRRRR